MKQLYFFIAFLSFANYSFGQVGINTTTPNAQLEIKSSNQATPANTDGVIIPKIDAFPASNPTAAQDGMMVYLTTNSGVNLAGFYYWNNATNSWKSVSGISSETDPEVSVFVANAVPYYNGTTLVAGVMVDNGTNVGVGITPTPGNKLHVDGKTLTSILEVQNKTTTDRFRVISGAVDKYVLQSDPNGNATWVNPNSLLITENDPQVSSTTANKIPKYNGTTLVDGTIFDNGTNVGVGTNNPQSKMEIEGADNPLELKLSSTSGFGASRLSFISDKDTNNEWRPAYIESGDNATGAFWGRLDFYTNGVGAGNKFGALRAMSISNGNLGIGYTNPSEKLEVNGKTKTTNLQITNGATANYVLQSDAVGNGNWVNNNGGFSHYLGELYLGGVIFELHKEADGLEHGLVVALTESLPLAWQSTVTVTNSTRTWDGVYNTNLMTDSPVRTYVNSLGIGWYLPSIDEINILFNNSFYVNKSLYVSGNTILNNTFVYWTSNEYIIYGGTYAYSKFPSEYPGLSPRTKTAPAYTRAIRSF